MKLLMIYNLRVGFCMKYFCPFCKTAKHVKEDRHRAEVYCSRCGLVLAAAPPFFATTNGIKYYYPYGFLI